MAAADNGFGLSFSPFDGKQGYNQDNTATPFQQAIQILSLRRPTIGGAAPVPNALFNAPGLGGMDFNAILQTLMRQFGGGGYHQPQMPREQMPGGMGTPPVTLPAPPAPPQLPAPRIDVNQNNNTNQPGPGTSTPSLPGPYGTPDLQRPRQA